MLVLNPVWYPKKDPSLMKRQIKKVLSLAAWSEIVIIDNNEPFVDLGAFIALNGITNIRIYNKPTHRSVSFLVRRSLLLRLVDAAKNLEQGYLIYVFEGWRSLESQQMDWNMCYQIIKKELTSNATYDIPESEIERQTSIVCARPKLLANHHCGGAIDVGIGLDDGTLLDMGTPVGYMFIAFFAHANKATYLDLKMKTMMLSEQLTTEQYRNRRRLRRAMGHAGFVWYPGECWHYCYGDRMWAVYSQIDHCFYGPQPEPVVEDPPTIKELRQIV